MHVCYISSIKRVNLKAHFFLKKMSHFNTLCLSGGGVRGYELLGAIAYLQEILDFNDINNFIGTSVGSLVGYLLAIGYTALEILILTNSSKIFDRLKTFNVMKMIQDGGAVEFTSIVEMVETLTIKKIGKLINLRQLKDDHGKTLKIITYNATKREKEVISPETHPDMPCICAIRMSCTLPFIFQPYEYNGCLYLDGGLVENLPISQVEDPQSTLAINLKPNPPSLEQESLYTNFNPVKYGVNILNIPIDAAIRRSVEKANELKIQLIEVTSGTKGFEFDLNTTQRLDLFSEGYNAAKEQYLK